MEMRVEVGDLAGVVARELTYARLEPSLSQAQAHKVATDRDPHDHDRHEQPAQVAHVTTTSREARSGAGAPVMVRISRSSSSAAKRPSRVLNASSHANSRVN